MPFITLTTNVSLTNDAKRQLANDMNLGTSKVSRCFGVPLQGVDAEF